MPFGTSALTRPNIPTKEKQLKSILKPNDLLKRHKTKEWFHKKLGTKSTQQHIDATYIKKQYLMTEQQMNQEALIDAVFKNFDADGSGALDVSEL